MAGTQEKRKVMYICVCRGITDTQILSAVEDGASSFRAVKNTLGVGTKCGRCTKEAKSIVKHALKSQNNACATGVQYMDFGLNPAY